MPSSTMQVAVLTRLFLSCMKLLGWRQMCFDSYHTLGLVYSKLEDYERATDFYMMAAHLNPKCSSLWELLYTWSKERGDIEKASYCLSKAITADPKDITLRSKHALLYVELRDYQKAAVAYEQVHHLCCENVDALKAAAKFYQKCRQVERSVRILEDYLKSQPDEANASVVDLLAAIFMETKAHDRALQHIEHAQMVNSGKELPLNLKIKAGICHVNIGNMEMAQGLLYLKIARCYLSLKERLQAILFFSKALETLQDDVDARTTLASLLLEEGKEDEAISLLFPPKDSDFGDAHSEKANRWWVNERIKLKLCNIYWSKGMLDDFVDAIFPLIRESLYVATLRQMGKSKKRLSRRDLLERVRVLNDPEKDNLFQGFRPIATPNDLLKAAMAKKLLQKKAIQKEEKKAEALASGYDWLSDDSDNEPQEVKKDPPLCNLLKDEEHHQLIIDL